MCERICCICGISARNRSYLRTAELQEDVKLRLSCVLAIQIDIDFNDSNDVCAICVQKVNNVVNQIHEMRTKCTLTMSLLKMYSEQSSDISWSDYQSSVSVKFLQSDAVVASTALIATDIVKSKTENDAVAVPTALIATDIVKTKTASDAVAGSTALTATNIVKPKTESNAVAVSTALITTDVVESETADILEYTYVDEKSQVNENNKSNINIEDDDILLEDDYTEIEWLSDVKYETNHNNVVETKLSNKSLVKKLKNTSILTNNGKKCFRINKRGYIYLTNSQDYISKQEDGSFICLLCEISFKYRFLAEIHVRSHHTKEKPFKCHICTKAFGASNYLKRHISSVHQKGRFTCSKCPQSFSRRYELTSHEERHKGQPFLDCLHVGCQMKFYDKITRRHHFLNSHAEKKFICDQCGEAFRKNYRLRNHQKLHETIKTKKINL